MSVLITGHRGYIGSALTRRFQGYPYQVVGYDIVDGHDILDYDTVLDILKKHDIKVVIHLAAMSSVTQCNESPIMADVVNRHGTEIILRAMKEAGCKNIIYASTSSVYGRSKDIPYTEQIAPDPCSPYGLSKLQGERVIRTHYEDNDGNYIIFRMFNVVGTSGYHDIDTATSAGYDRLFAALESGSVTIYGKDYLTKDGTAERDYVALKDVCEAFYLAVQTVMSEDVTRYTLNISTGELTSVQTMINTWNHISDCIEKGECGYELFPPLQRVKYTYGDKRAGDPAQVYGVNTNAKRILNWRPHRKIEDIIRDLIIDKKYSNVQS